MTPIAGSIPTLKKDGPTMVVACPKCGSIRRVYLCECTPPGRIQGVPMPAEVAERLRELTDRAERTCMIGRHTVRVYTHAGVQFDGQGRVGAVGFLPLDWTKVVEFVRGRDLPEETAPPSPRTDQPKEATDA